MKPEQDRLQVFRQVYEANARILLHFARRFTSPDVAEDIVQDVFVQLWEKEKLFDIVEARFYLFTAVRNRCINVLKQEQLMDKYINHTQANIHLLSLQQYESPEQLLVKEENWHEIHHQINSLPEKCREIFKLAYLEEKKNKEIADSLKLSIRTVEHHLYLGLKILRSKLVQKEK